MGFVLDTNLNVAANRNRDQADSLTAFYKKHLRATHLHAVVVQEIPAGARNREDARATHGFFIDPFERANRIIVPTYGIWKRVGEIIWHLAERKLISRPTLLLPSRMTSCWPLRAGSSGTRS